MNDLDQCDKFFKCMLCAGHHLGWYANQMPKQWLNQAKYEEGKAVDSIQEVIVCLGHEDSVAIERNKRAFKQYSV